MYCGLLALDDATRRWFAAHSDVLADVAARHAAHFFIAAPGLRIRDNVVQLPGGAAATAAWESAVGKRASDPAAFIKAVVGRNEVALSYFIGSFAQLSPEQARCVLGVDGAEQARTTAIRRMVTAFDRVSTGLGRDREAVLASDAGPGAPRRRTSAPARTARRTCRGRRRSGRRSSRHPSPDARHTEAVSTLVTGPSGGVLVALRADFHRRTDADSSALPAGPVRLAADSRHHAQQRPRRARRAPRREPVPGRWPGRSSGRTSPGSAPTPMPRSGRGRSRRSTTKRAAQMALVQFQGALAVIARAASRGGLSPDRAADLVSSLSAINLDAQGEYAGKVVEWVSDTLLAGEGRAAGAATAADATEAAIRARRGTAGTALGPGRGSRPRCRMGRHAISRQLHQRRGVPSPAPAG